MHNPPSMPETAAISSVISPLPLDNEKTHQPTIAPTNNTPTIDPPMINATLFFCTNERAASSPCGSGSTNLKVLPTICAFDGGFAGSKQYLPKHLEQISLRGVRGDAFSRARSSKAHWRQFPNSASGRGESGVKPLREALNPCRRKVSWNRRVYDVLNESVLVALNELN
jgi:hypothetical protein